MVVRVIDGEHFFPAEEKASFQAFFQRVPVFNRHIQVIAGEQTDKEADIAEPAYFAVDLFVLDQAADLTVEHAVELCRKDNVIAVVPVLGEEGEPALAADVLPLTAVKEQLGFVYDQQDLTLF